MSKKQDRLMLEMRASLHEMLNEYWGPGDGEMPPEFIVKAAALSGFALKNYQGPHTGAREFGEREIPVSLKGDEWFAVLALAGQRKLSPNGYAVFNRGALKIKNALLSESARAAAVVPLADALLRG